jgi:hypothetical protein
MLVLQILAVALMIAGIVWVIRRLVPAVSCPHCASSSWMIMGDMKQCRECGKLFV